MPTVTGLRGQAGLRGNKLGLHLRNGTTNPVQILGTDLSMGLKVTIRYGGTFDDPDVKWTGNLNGIGMDNTEGTGVLTCANKYEPPQDMGGDVGEGEDVTVTVGEAASETRPVALKVNLDT
jgi:hypothetical protein